MKHFCGNPILILTLLIIGHLMASTWGLMWFPMVDGLGYGGVAKSEDVLRK
jgi:hypothetical protein